MAQRGEQMVQKIFKALLFDTRSIQRYIYSGDRLRTNVGASYIVDRLFFEVLINGRLIDGKWVNGVLKDIFPEDRFPTGNDAWDPAADDLHPWDEMKSCCVAYVGGGNALVLFDSSQTDRRVEVVEKFTRRLLVERPGLKVGAALGDLKQLGDELNRDDIDKLYRKLKENQNRIFPTVNVPYSGLTLGCEINGETANFYGRLGAGEIKFYSQEAAVKSAAAEEAKENLHDRFNKIFERKNFSPASDFDFPTEVEKLGQKTGENYFAIVHVDGNNMGAKFRQCTSLTERRKLSREIRRKTEGVFADLLAKIIRMKDEQGFGDALVLDEKFLPIRPLIIGGDDVTFFCPAKTAILFTKTLMEILYATTPEDAPEHLTQPFSRRMDSCAGIAILPTKYPFFRGYELAEQLCGAAKKSMREFAQSQNAGESSWLDFAILHGEQAPTLEQIRSTEYSGAHGRKLHFGAYLVCGAGDSAHRLDKLLDCTTQFLEGKEKRPPLMANNKIKELRVVLQHGQDDARKFLRQLRHQGQDLPTVPGWENFKANLWHDNTTPYVDAIELMDFYSLEVAAAWQRLT